jgi:hypothetical protein
MAIHNIGKVSMQQFMAGAGNCQLNKRNVLKLFIRWFALFLAIQSVIAQLYLYLSKN